MIFLGIQLFGTSKINQIEYFSLNEKKHFSQSSRYFVYKIPKIKLQIMS